MAWDQTTVLTKLVVTTWLKIGWRNGFILSITAKNVNRLLNGTFGDRIKASCSTSGTGSTLTFGSTVCWLKTLSRGVSSMENPFIMLLATAQILK